MTLNVILKGFKSNMIFLFFKKKKNTKTAEPDGSFACEQTSFIPVAQLPEV